MVPVPFLFRFFALALRPSQTSCRSTALRHQDPVPAAAAARGPELERADVRWRSRYSVVLMEIVECAFPTAG